jgi:hypothetical protein
MSAPTKEVIAEEAANKFCFDWGIINQPLETALIRAFKSAIDKAKTDLKEANDNLFKIANKYRIENRKLKNVIK